MYLNKLCIIFVYCYTIKIISSVAILWLKIDYFAFTTTHKYWSEYNYENLFNWGNVQNNSSDT